MPTALLMIVLPRNLPRFYGTLLEKALALMRGHLMMQWLMVLIWTLKTITQQDTRLW